MTNERDNAGDDAALFDSIVNGSADESAVETVAETAAAPEPNAGQPRDDSGRFAQKAQSEPEPQAEETKAPTHDAPAIPPHRLREEAEGRRAEKERADRLEAMLMQFMQQQRQPAQPVQPQAPPPDLFEAPDQFIDHRLESKITPELTQIRQAVLYNSRLVAGQVYGSDKVQAAETAFNEAARTGQMDPATHQRINSSPNPFAAAVEWYQREQTLKTVGNDVEAFKANVLEEAIRNPEFVAKVVESFRNGGQAPQQSNRIQLPPSLNKATSAAPTKPRAGGGDVSDQELFNSITARR